MNLEGENNIITQSILDEVMGSLKNEPITISQSQTPSSGMLPKFKHWKELGNFMDKNQVISPNVTSGKVFTNMKYGSKNPLDQPMKYRICNSCDNPILEELMFEHLGKCQELKEKRRASYTQNGKIANGRSANNMNVDDDDDDDDDDDLDEEDEQSQEDKNNTSNSKNSKEEPISISNTTNNTTTTTKTTPSIPKKRQAPAPKKERKKKDTKPKVAKPKGPVDVEKQCGVPLPNGTFCARSLTCKTHSMGAKRAVQGRSLPYDQLLAAYQRKNQIKLGAAAAAAQQAKDELEHGAHVALDDEEETQQVLEGVKKNLPLPLEKRVIMPVRYRTKYLRMREMFANSILPRLTNNPLGQMQGRAAVMNLETLDEQSVFPVRSQHQKNAQQRALLKAQQIQQAKMQALR